MAKLELELQGNFDDVLLDIERCMLVDEESSSDTSVDGNRLAVRTYNVGVNLTLMETGRGIRLTAVNTDDSGIGSALGINSYSQDLYFTAIKDAVDKYRVDRSNDSYVSPMETYLDIDETTGFYDRDAVSLKEDGKQTEDISLAEDLVVNEYVSEKKEETRAVDEDKADKGVKVACACSVNNKKELYESSYEHSSDTRYNPITRYLSDGGGFWGSRAKRIRRYRILNVIAQKLSKNREDNNYDYEMLVDGADRIVWGAMPLLMYHFVVSRYINLGDSKSEYTVYFIIFIIVTISMIVKGIVYVLKPTQLLYRRRMWRIYVDKFKYTEAVIPATASILDKTPKDIEKSNEMILYDNHAKFYVSGMIIEREYENMECIYETDNMFVVMVQNDYIYSFQKSDMSSETETKVRNILMPYYDRSYS